MSTEILAGPGDLPYEDDAKRTVIVRTTADQIVPHLTRIKVSSYGMDPTRVNDYIAGFLVGRVADAEYNGDPAWRIDLLETDADGNPAHSQTVGLLRVMTDQTLDVERVFFTEEEADDFCDAIETMETYASAERIAARKLDVGDSILIRHKGKRTPARVFNIVFPGVTSRLNKLKVQCTLDDGNTPVVYFEPEDEVSRVETALAYKLRSSA